MKIREAIKKLVRGEDLTERQAGSVFRDMMSGGATEAQIASFLTALSLKGETVEEITGAARVMRRKSVKIKVGNGRRAVVDTCGTGGSGKDVFNVSTVSAFVIAGCDITVAKHGNRAASSRCGSADVLYQLGVNIELPPERVAGCIKETGIGFLFAPLYHPSMKCVAGVRKEMGIRTIFNILGPLANPAGANCQVLGVFSVELTRKMASVLSRLGVKRAFVVHGSDGLDEITPAGRTMVSEVRGKTISNGYLSPRDFGIKRSGIERVKGGTLKKNARMINEVLSGAKGPSRDIVLMNSALALIAAGRSSSPVEAKEMAERCIDEGRALSKLKLLREFTNRNAPEREPEAL